MPGRFSGSGWVGLTAVKRKVGSRDKLKKTRKQENSWCFWEKSKWFGLRRVLAQEPS